jgi:hypothetical protein
MRRWRALLHDGLAANWPVPTALDAAIRVLLNALRRRGDSASSGAGTVRCAGWYEELIPEGTSMSSALKKTIS